ncbi:Serine/threonine-protein phosphatase [Caenorhabditis elegans]|uniref:Serine/threonine-protein phosphatase n=1 Tax=Caenorhabditis elegans TaxID=6239 RepID=Q27494_CAEEL|nr:Serine/threonine-protein phosphatase [Caenorhabditis elegans]CAA95811.2 Serine/threonine-protein phosphatase [Caenorhabditis elegans]|eukprot:NP_492012.1 Serine/threonine-protein phosphatase [Caenorhabditis elegans]
MSGIEFEARMKPGTPDDLKKLHSWLESIIFRYFHVWSPVNCQDMLKRYEIYELCLRARELFWTQPLYRHVEVPVTIVGDIHGQFEDLKMMMDMNGWPFTEDEAKEMCKNLLLKGGKDGKQTFPAVLGSGTDRQKTQKNYLFLGDYVDRGPYSIEVVLMLFAMHLRWPDRVTLLRGNHESRPVNRQYGFYGECVRRYSERIYEVFQLAFNAMPLTAIVNKRIMCMHGGISEELFDLKQLDALKRPIDTPDIGIIADLTWADPECEIDYYKESPRGAGKIFGAKAVDEFCKHFQLDLIVRAHQVVQDGYEFFADRKLVTIFSAPFYCGQTNNIASMLNIDKDMVASFMLVKPVTEIKENQNVGEKADDEN